MSRSFLRYSTAESPEERDLHENRKLVYIGIFFVLVIVFLTSVLVSFGKLPSSEFVTIAVGGITAVTGFLSGFLTGRQQERKDSAL